MNEIIYYNTQVFQNLPSIINKRIDKGGKFCFAINGQTVSKEVSEAYFDMMDDFNIGFAFYPYSECIKTVNTVFGKYNPILEIRMVDGTYVHAVRQINYGAMFFDCEKFDSIKLDENMKFAFMDKFADDLASTGAIPSNGMFIDLFESWTYFKPYRKSVMQYTPEYQKEIENSGIKLDNDTSRILKFINEYQKRKGMLE